MKHHYKPQWNEVVTYWSNKNIGDLIGMSEVVDEEVDGSGLGV